MKLVLLLILCVSSFNSFAQTDDEPVNIKFNSVYYFVPADQFSDTQSEIIKASSYITIDFEMKSIKILTYFSNPPTESTYTMKSVDNSTNNLYKFVCSATNYAEVIIEVDLSNMTVTRKVTHNGILHKYYNE